MWDVLHGVATRLLLLHLILALIKVSLLLRLTILLAWREGLTHLMLHILQTDNLLVNTSSWILQHLVLH